MQGKDSKKTSETASTYQRSACEDPRWMVAEPSIELTYVATNNIGTLRQSRWERGLWMLGGIIERNWIFPSNEWLSVIVPIR